MTDSDNRVLNVPEGDEAYFEDPPESSNQFDSRLISEPLKVLKRRQPLIFTPGQSVTQAMTSMQTERRGCVLVTSTGDAHSPLLGIFTERDVLYRIVGRGRNPQGLPLSEVMTEDPECVPEAASIAWVLNKMAIGGFRHVPAVDDDHRPSFVISVRDIVEFLVDFFPDDVLNLPPDFGPPRSTRREGA